MRDGAGSRLRILTGGLLRLASVAIALLIYLLGFLHLEPSLGLEAVLLSLLPVGIVAWFGGLRWGMASALVATPINAVLVKLLAPGTAMMGLAAGLPEMLAVILAAGAIGRLSDIERRLRAEEAEWHRAEDALRESEARKGAILESSADCIIAMDVGGCILEFNPAAERTFGFRRGYAVGRAMVDLIIPSRERAALREAINGMMKISYRNPVCRTFEATGLRSDGTEVPLEMSMSVFHYGGQTVCSASLRDITERRLQEQALQYQAYHDPLTGLPNRTLFHDRLEQAMLKAEREGNQLAVLILDLNGFKDVNDTLGHHYGDELLKEVAERLRSQVRASDTVARLGGDEFGVILPQVDDRAAATVLAEKLGVALQPSIELDHHVLQVRASVGIGLFPDDGHEVNVLLRRADAAMYASKRSNRRSLRDRAL